MRSFKRSVLLVLIAALAGNFASAAEKDLFRKAPLRYAGLVTDPITMERFRPTASSPKTTYGGRLYYFSADSTRAQFLANPVLHQDRRTGKN